MRTVRFLYEQLRGYRLVLVLSTAMAFLQVGADLLAAFPLKFILDKVINHKNPGWPMSGLVARFDSLGTREGLHSHETYTLMAVIAASAVLIVILGLIGAAVSYVQLYAAKQVGFKVSGRLRTRVFERILRLSVDWHGQMKTGDLVQRLTGNVADLEKLIIDGLVDMMAGILTLVAMVGVMAAFNWQFTLLSIFVVPMLFVIVWSYTKKIKVNTRLAAQAAAQVADVATEDIRAIHEVKAFTLEQAASSHFEQHVDTYRNWGLLAGKLEAQFRPIVAFVVTVSTFTVVGVGSYVATGHSFQIAWLVIPAGTLTIGTLTVFLTYIKQLYQPMRDLSKLMYVGSNAASGAERIQNLLDEPAEVEATVEPVVIPPSARLVGAIDYENVVFGYDLGIPVLRGIDLHIEAGQKLALVGLSGSGKTTLVKLIPRFHVPWEGRVLIDDVENQRYPLAVVRKNTSFVLQDSVLFEGTIRDNIAIGRPDATDGQIVAAARQGQIDDFIRSLPGAYDFHVREQGKNFSAGQRQRLAIARAVLRDAPILIMDEPTANLDVEAEAEVMYAIHHLVEGRTVIMISHRLSTLGQVDRVAFLESGRLVEEGDYETLRYAGGPFARLFQERSTPAQPRRTASAAGMEATGRGRARARGRTRRRESNLTTDRRARHHPDRSALDAWTGHGFGAVTEHVPALPPAVTRRPRGGVQPERTLSIPDLPRIITSVLERAGMTVLPGYEGRASMSIRHLRCEPGKGLVAVFNAYPARSSSGRSPAAGTRARPVALSSVKGWAWSSNRLLTLTLGDEVLDVSRIRFDSLAVGRAPIELKAPGIVSVPDLALSIQAFPADSALPTLADCFDSSERGPVFASLELAARTLLGDAAWRLADVRAEALRYKPASRCVILYELALEHPQLAGGASEGRSRLVVCGKAYADREHARAVCAVQESLHRESQGTMGEAVAGHTARSPLVPRPLGHVDDLALLLSEMVHPTSSANGIDAPAAEDSWKPRVLRGRGGVVVDLNTPTTKIRCAAATMARLHTSTISTFVVPPRTCAGDVKQVRERALHIAAKNRAEADNVLALSRRVAECLEAAESEVLMPGHGSFKPTELLFRDGDAIVIDLDKIGLADPAGDVGCFLAYLRPSSLWYQRSGMRQWFDRAADDFVIAYRRAMLDLDVASSVIDGILERTRGYEAAKLFRIAVRHVARANSPRPRELAAICGDIGECLDDSARWSTASQR